MHISKIKIMNLITNNEIIIFSPDYNETLNTELLSNYKNIIFSNYELCWDLFDKYKNNIFNGLTLKFNVFNKPVDNLPNSIISLTFGYNFNQSVDNLPNGIKNLTFGVNFDKLIYKLPFSLKKIVFYYQGYEYIDKNLKNIFIEKKYCDFIEKSKIDYDLKFY